jgi:hypothetical protein
MRAKNGSKIILGMLVVFGLTVAFSGCGGSESGSDKIVGPSPATLAGDYTLISKVTTDTCGMGTPSATSGNIRLAPGGNGLELTQTLLGGMCNTFASQQSGNVLTQARTDTLVYGDCTLQVQTTSTLSFTGTHFNSIEARHYDYGSGTCPAFSPCDVVKEGQGDLCADCFPGCLSVPSEGGAGAPRPALHLTSVEE